MLLDRLVRLVAMAPPVPLALWDRPVPRAQPVSRAMQAALETQGLAGPRVTGAAAETQASRELMERRVLPEQLVAKAIREPSEHLVLQAKQVLKVRTVLLGLQALLDRLEPKAATEPMVQPDRKVIKVTSEPRVMQELPAVRVYLAPPDRRVRRVTVVRQVPRVARVIVEQTAVRALPAQLARQARAVRKETQELTALTEHLAATEPLEQPVPRAIVEPTVLQAPQVRTVPAAHRVLRALRVV